MQHTRDEIIEQIAYWQRQLAACTDDADTDADTEEDATDADDGSSGFVDAATDSLFDRLPEDTVLEIEDAVMQHLDDWVHSGSVLQMAKPDGRERWVNDVVDLMLDGCLASGVMAEAGGVDDEDQVRDDLTAFVDARIDVYLSMGIMPPRFVETVAVTEPLAPFSLPFDTPKSESPKSESVTDIDTERIRAQIAYLRGVQQPAQRTPEWYAFRHTLLSASNAYKALGSEAQRNSLIYEKCTKDGGLGVGVGVGTSTSTSGGVGSEDDYGRAVNTDSPMHWGQKYEPVARMIYEAMFGGEVEDFGCIRHPTHPFLGASPDGVVVAARADAVRSTYGHMIEIKCPTTRVITGVPTEAYWVQMQLQMEVCDLDTCDFVETRFREVPDADAFFAAAADADPLEGLEEGSENGNGGAQMGIILYFLSNTQVGSTPHYVYMPLGKGLCKCLGLGKGGYREAVEAWIAAKRAEMRAENYLLYQTLYWVLDEVSVVCVRRNRPWFAAALPVLRETWRTIEHERVHGCAHRAPKRRETKQPEGSGGMWSTPGICVVKLE